MSRCKWMLGVQRLRDWYCGIPTLGTYASMLAALAQSCHGTFVAPSNTVMC